VFKSLKLYKEAGISLDQACQKLVELGYARQERVSEEGDFSRRGGILDIFAFSFELPIRIEFQDEKILFIRTFNPVSGDYLWEHTMVIVLAFSRAQTFKSLPLYEEFPLDNFVDLKIGDYVVHNKQGVGRFLGIQKIKVKDKTSDHLVVEYDRQEKLLVPVAEMNLVHKYLAFEAKRPKLCRLGSKNWLATKQRVQKGVQKLAWELISLQAMRLSLAGFSFAVDDDWQKKFDDGFIYEETADQIKAVEEVKRDMQKALPMDRLLCGDVGYGKTEVAMRASFTAVTNSKQVAILAPTTILAQQHYQNFLFRFQGFPVVIACLSRFSSASQQKKIVQRIASGQVDIVIGTHRLLSKDVCFKDLGLVIIDEEQRFGVRAKEKMKSFRLIADVLTLTATPIPRTLYMGLMGARDLSVINTPPENRLPIRSVVVEYDEDLIRQAVVKEAARRGQVFFLHNRVEDIEKVKEKLARILPDNIRIATGHGQMPALFLEKVMSDFLRGKIDVLVCTMIIQSGIDIPNANTLIVNNAHRFGLADLHQLRGRVGRLDRPAFAYFFIPKNAAMDSQAQRRLAAIQDYSGLGSGFKIAMEDLQLRGAGNILGDRQHGFISAVGFDLYCRLLRETIGNLKKTGLYKDEYEKLN
jgi:transcription-repair coupling factor (superfamily II helicase)